MAYISQTVEPDTESAVSSIWEVTLLSTITNLLLIPILIGAGIVVAISAGYSYRARATMRVDENSKRRAIHWSAAGAAFCGVSVGLQVFLIQMVTPQIHGSAFTKALIASSLGFIVFLGLVGGVLLDFVLLESIILPARRRAIERSQLKHGE